MSSMFHIGERASSGIRRIISAWSSAGYETPEINERIGPDKGGYWKVRK